MFYSSEVLILYAFCLNLRSCTLLDIACCSHFIFGLFYFDESLNGLTACFFSFLSFFFAMLPSLICMYTSHLPLHSLAASTSKCLFILLNFSHSFPIQLCACVCFYMFSCSPLPAVALGHFVPCIFKLGPLIPACQKVLCTSPVPRLFAVP